MLIRKIPSKLVNLFDWVVAFWPSAGGGLYLRRLFWCRRFRHFGRNVCLGDQITVVGFPNICIGNDVSIMSGGFLYADDSPGLEIGDDCSFNNNVFVGASGGKIRIGRNVLIGPNVVLRASDHAFEDIRVPIRDQGHRYGEIFIEDDVWIGANAVITSGVRIGKGAVVGAGAVVTSEIPSFSIAAGVPAKVIKMRINNSKDYDDGPTPRFI